MTIATVVATVAAGVFAGAGLTLSPAVGAVLMSVSTIVVAANAQLLRRLKLRGHPILATPPVRESAAVRAA